MDSLLTATVTVGFAFGMQHALDPDHLVAVSTIVGEQKSIRRSSLIGTFWGMGHTTSLLAVGLVVIFSKQAIPPRVAAQLELPVAFMLVYLGIQTLRKSLKGWHFHVHTHSHDGHEHVHFHAHQPGGAVSGPHHHHDPLRFALRPYLVGIVHGMAGSGALMLLVLSTVPTVTKQLSYIASFGVGSIAGMLAMSAAISIPFAFTAIRFEQVNRYIQAGAGMLSLVFGCFLLWQHAIIR
jgi:ABC-type nickel/cobalt efflux system permease component RcnA